MITFQCTHCGQTVYFENTHCGACGSTLGFEPTSLRMLAFQIDQDGKWRASFESVPSKDVQGESMPGKWQPCTNYTQYAEHYVCNWLVPGEGQTSLCQCCRHTEIIPALHKPGNIDAWAKLEGAKRRLFYELLAFNLPIPVRSEDPSGLVFRFLEDQPETNTRVLTGHDNGVITLNIAEANDAIREERRTSMHEPYRTLLGHFRHEVGHFYWDQLVSKQPTVLEAFRNLFGDDRQDYAQALKVHYDQGAPDDWPLRFISAYASTHPWEDWAETWAHYMHICDGLETAAHWGVGLHRRNITATGKVVHPQVVRGLGGENMSLFAAQTDEMPNSFLAGYADQSIEFREALLDQWLPLSRFLNSMGRSLGQGDLYPFVMADPVLDKLCFVHAVVTTYLKPNPVDASAEITAHQL